MIRRQAEQAAPGEGTRPPLVGHSLREQRERLGWDLGEVADWLRIRRSYLQALEDGQPAALPSGTYTIGFLRSYATALGLDPQEVVERFRLETRGLLGHPDLSFPSPVPERGVPAGAAILLGVVLLIGAYAGWYVFSARDAVPVQPVPAVPEAMLPQPVPPVARPAPGPPPPPVAATATADASPPASAPQSVMPAPSQPVPATAAPTARPEASPVVPAPLVPASVAPAAPISPAPVAADAVTLRATAATWVQVRKADGTVVYDHLLAQGDSWTVPETSPPLVLTTGNAGGLALALGDVTGPVLGRSGAVIRRLSLDPAAVRAINAKLAGSPAPASPSGHTAAP
ncbi:helix-turn-helix domain-containing protein [Lichenicoccus roseus]|uniref:Helix-turn-helix domain-containing protein n=1 Tax=Lichenicoccus roseus TaxID=2683649 RepID=A0A5R9JBL2_9PROT|nr:helix-turn-helix domain-containing protein [Lichenicoccus roseus]TLU72776.1 helix-turn-helix domain-containing protein [Lichenicoccus roseus]